MDGRSLGRSSVWEEPSIRMKHLKKRRQLRTWTQLLSVCVLHLCAGESQT